MGVNKVILIGNLGNDPESKKTNSGHNVTTLSLATSNSWLNRDGQKQEHTEWHRVIVWGKLADTCAEYLSKGSKAYIEGRLQTRSWEDDKGVKKYTTEIVASQVLFLSTNPAAKKTQTSASYPKEPSFGANNSADKNAEDIPF